MSATHDMSAMTATHDMSVAHDMSMDGTHSWYTRVLQVLSDEGFEENAGDLKAAD